MNERIKQLVGMALDKAVPYTWNNLDHVEIEKVMKEFAELIVRECLNQLQELVPPQVINENHQELVNSVHSYALVVSGAKIKKHFGVKE